MNKSFYVLGCTIQIECHQFFHGIPQVCAVAKNHGMRARYQSTGASITGGGPGAQHARGPAPPARLSNGHPDLGGK